MKDKAITISLTLSVLFAWNHPWIFALLAFISFYAAGAVYSVSAHKRCYKAKYPSGEYDGDFFDWLAWPIALSVAMDVFDRTPVDEDIARWKRKLTGGRKITFQWPVKIGEPEAE